MPGNILLRQAVPAMRSGVVLLTVSVIFQFLLELTLGRSFVAPSMLSLTLVYMTLNRGPAWAVDGAFWSGLCLDLLLHQPPGSTSLALITGLWVVRMLSRVSVGEGMGNVLAMTAVATIVSDSVFIVLASKPFGSGFGVLLLMVLPRALMTVACGGALLGLREWIAGLRPGSGQTA